MTEGKKADRRDHKSIVSKSKSLNQIKIAERILISLTLFFILSAIVLYIAGVADELLFINDKLYSINDFLRNGSKGTFSSPYIFYGSGYMATSMIFSILGFVLSNASTVMSSILTAKKIPSALDKSICLFCVSMLAMLLIMFTL
jgi:hypothetical protein